MIRISLVFDPSEAEENERSIEEIAESLNLEVAPMSAAYQGFRVESDDDA